MEEKEIEILQNDLDRANSKLKENIEIRLKAIKCLKELIKILEGENKK